MNKLKLYVQDSIDELLYKVSWPTWSELQSTTMVVLFSLLVFASLVFIIDFVLGANPENPYFKGIIYYIYSML